MEIVRLPAGHVASEATDCIQIQEHADGGFTLTGSVLIHCGDSDEAESASVGGFDRYGDFAIAEATGIAWAREAGVARLHVARSDGTTPLPDIYDGP